MYNNYNYRMISEQINKLETDWKDLLKSIDHENLDEYFVLNKDEKYLPLKENIFNAFKLFNIEETKVVFIFQDPYISYCKKTRLEQAHGIALSVRDKTKFPPSLKNFFIELNNDLGVEIPKTGDLTEFSKMNKILMLNASLTVREKKSNSHAKLWKKYTDELINKINNKCSNLVFVLLGNFAKKKCKNINLEKHKVLKGVHPSPLSARRGFFGSKIFSRLDCILEELGKEKINYSYLK